MAQLSTIISSILRDMIMAQHEANMYAISLEDVYKQMDAWNSSPFRQLLLVRWSLTCAMV